MNLKISENDSSVITVENLKVAQFIYLLLNNSEIRDIIDTITGKAVLILGRFSRKDILYALKAALRERGYISIVFDFDNPPTRNLGETVEILARLSRFIIADLTDPSSVPYELGLLVPHISAIPLQPIILSGKKPFVMTLDFKDKPWILPIYHYHSKANLLDELDEGCA